MNKRLRTRLHIPKTSKFTYALWHWTCAHESLFTLTTDTLAIYSQLCEEANRS